MADSTDTETNETEQMRREVKQTAKELADQVTTPEKKKVKERPVEFSFKDLKNAFYLNEYGDADIAISLFKNRFVRDNSTGDFYQFAGHRWHRCLNREQEGEFREVAEIYGKEAAACNERMIEAKEKEDDAEKKSQQRWRDNFNARAKALRGNARIRNVLNLATAGPGSLGISGQGWNPDHHLLPVANGVVDLETGKLRDGVYSDWFSFGSPVEYKGYRHRGKFVPEFLMKLLCEDDSLFEYIQYLLGFACTGIQTKDFFVAYGPLGNNGKSVLFDWVCRVLGEFAANIPVELIYEDRFGRDPDKPSPQILRLRHLRLAVMSEPDNNKRLSTSKVKYLTSGTDKIGNRNLQEKRITEFWPTHTTVMHGNEVPRVIGHQGPFYDRLRLIPFRARFINNIDEIDESKFIFKQTPRVEMVKLLKEHDSEMLSFLVRCARKSLAMGDMPTPPKIVIDETKTFRDYEDIVGRYLRQCTDKNKEAAEQAKDLYRSFCYFCREELGLTSKQTPSQKAIYPDLRAQPHIERIETNTIYYKGISIKIEWRAPEDFK